MVGTTRIYLKVLFCILGYICIAYAENETVPGNGMPPTGPAQKPPGAIASFVKMIMDIPMGLVEAFKDAADGIEALVVAFMRGLL